MKTENHKKITIEIPDGLSPAEEAGEIGKRLLQKSLSGGGNNKEVKRIGERTKVKHLETVIVVKRKADNYIETLQCSICKVSYQSDMAKKVFVNYGGTIKQLKYCSDECCKTLIEICGPGRAALKRKDLKFTYLQQ